MSLKLRHCCEVTCIVLICIVVTLSAFGPCFALRELPLIGGWGIPLDDYAKNYGINFARVVYKPNDESARMLCLTRIPFITVNLNPKESKGKRKSATSYLNDVTEWGRLSISYSCIKELAQDDFHKWWKCNHDKSSNIIVELKKRIEESNPRLLFGVTIYEDDLEKLTKKELTWLGKQINVIHFYLHKRTRAPELGAFVGSLGVFFPKAKILVGIYRYDRREYEKRNNDSLDKELRLFEMQLDASFKLKKEGKVGGIEFYPGRLGKEIELVQEKKLYGDPLEAFMVMSELITFRLKKERCYDEY